MNWPLLKNSLLVSGSVTILALVFGFLAALFASSHGKGLRTVTVAGAVLVLALPPFLVTNTWMHYFGLAGVWRPYLDWNLYSPLGVVLLLGLTLWPISFLMFLPAWRNLSQTQLEVDPRLQGRNLMRWLLLPTLRNILPVAAIATFVLAFNNFSIPALLQVKVYPAELWLRFNVRFDYLEAFKLSWPLLVGPLCLLLLARSRTISLKPGKTLNPQLLADRLGKEWLVASAVSTALLIFFSAILPLVQLGSSARTFSELIPAFSAGKAALGNSLIIATLAGAVAVLLALATQKVRTIGYAGWMLFLAPGLLLGIAVVYLFNRPMFTFFYTSLGLVIMGLGLRYFAPAWSGWNISLKSIPVRWVELMRLHQGNAWQRLKFLHFPALHPQLCALFCIAYLFCLWDVETLIFFIPAGKETLSIRIFNMLHYGHANQVNALCVIMLGAALLPMALYGLLKQGYLLKKYVVIPLITICLFLTGCSRKTDNAGLALQSDFFNEIRVLGFRGTGAGQFNKPRSVIVDKDQNIFVMDITGRMQKFGPDLGYSMAWQMPETDIGKPKGMTLDEQGNVVLVEPHYNRVNHFTSSGKLQYQWGKGGTNAGEFVFPRSIAITAAGNSFLSEYGLAERIQKFSRHGGEFLLSFGEPGTGPGQFNRVEGIGIDYDDRIYAADSCNHRIQIFSAEGKLLGMFGTPGNGLGELSYPYDIRIDKLGYKFVCEFGNSRIQIFSPDNQPLEIIGMAGSEPGKFFNPWSIALDQAGNLYVADSGNHRVQIFMRKSPLPHPTHGVDLPQQTSHQKGNRPGRS